MASRWIKWLGLLLALLTLAAQGASLSAPTEDPDGARVIVRFKLSSSLMRIQAATGGERRGPQHAATMGERTGLGLRDGHMLDTRTQVLHGDKSLSSTALAARLAAEPDVEFAYPDLRRHILALPNDALFAASPSISPVVGQWYLQAPDATLVSAINAPAAWALTTGSAGIVVADIDTGVRFEHPDLTNKLLSGYNFFSASGTSSGWSADATDPGDYTTANQCGDLQPATPSSWHGTQVMGLLGAQTDNGIGMASVGREVMLLPVRALGPCGGYDSDIVAGMLWAAGMSLPVNDPLVPNPGNVPANPNPAKVINLSLGSSGSCSDLGGRVYAIYIPEIIAQGVTVVAAAGNQEGLAVSVPANCPGVIAVAAVRHTGTKVGFSNVGPEVAIAAPGGNCVNPVGQPCLYPILTTTNTGTTTAVGSTYSNSSNYSVGTSFATPLVAGTAALMLSANPGLKPAQVKSLLQGSVRAFPSTSIDPAVTQCHAPSGVVQDECICTTSTCGAGLLDAGAAVAAAASGATPTASVSPSAATATAGASLSFDGSASSAPSGRTIASYQWTLGTNTAGATISGSSTAATVIVSTASFGSFTLRLTVTDSKGAQASTSVPVTVNAAAAPTVSLQSSAAAVAAGSPVTFDGSGSTAANGLSIVSYQWAITSGSAIASFSSGTSASTAAVATLGSGSGSFTVQLTVTDSEGSSSRRSTSVTVTALAPTASVSASATSVSAGGSVTFDGSGSQAPSGRTITGYQWAITSGGAIASFSGSATGPSASVATSAAGSFTVQLTVTDSAGAHDSRSASVTVTEQTVVVTPPSGGGGGAFSGYWLLGLALAIAALARERWLALAQPRGPQRPS